MSHMKGEWHFYKEKGFYCKLGIFLVLFYICWCFPVIADDWYAVGDHHSLMDMFTIIKDRYLSLNGRVLGNSFLHYFIDHKFVLCLIRCGTIFSIAWIICRFNEARGLIHFLAALALVFCLPKAVFAQTYPWAAGFFNYVPPVLLILLYLYLIRGIFSHQEIKSSVPSLFLVFFLGVSSQLFVEHMTVYNVVMAAAVAVWYLVVQKKISWLTVSYALGAMAGCTIMFSSPALKSGDYRTSPAGLDELIQMARKQYGIVSALTIGTNYLLTVLLSLVFLYLIYQGVKKGIGRRYLSVILSVILTAAPFYFYAANNLIKENFYINGSAIALLIDIAVTFGYFLALLATGVLYGETLAQKTKTVFLLCSILVLNGPLLIVSPIGPRNFYGSYILLICLLFVHLPQILDKPETKEYLRVPIAVSFAVVFTLSAFMFTKIRETEQLRTQLISQQMAQHSQTITIPEFPYAGYLWGASDNRLQVHYYYEKQGDITFNIVPYKQWKQ